LHQGLEDLKHAFESGAVIDYTAVEYSNQRFLQSAGAPAYEQAFDAQIMAAFGNVQEAAAFRETAARR
jgi:hypothetical protein